VGRALVELLTANFTPEMSNWDAAVLAEVQAPGYRRQEPEPAKGWLNRLLG
jgi:hypothetical protein